MHRVLLLLVTTMILSACGAGPAAQAVSEAPVVDAERLMADLRYLASDELAGRGVGTPGNAAAREYIVSAFEWIGLAPVAGSYTHAFRFTGRRDGVEREGVNVLGVVEGTTHPDRWIVVTAHYDHVGIGRPDESGDSIYNGADDNASGTAALLALAAYFKEHRPAHTILFAALDAEEMGLQGARALVAQPPVPLEQIVANVNMDMVSRGDKGELYAVGTYHYPQLLPLVERIAARSKITLLTGHDRPDLPPGDDWTMASDHGPFHRAGIPFLYFGVEDHPDYHRPSDEADKVDPAFYAAAVETVIDAVREIDREPPQR